MSAVHGAMGGYPEGELSQKMVFRQHQNHLPAAKIPLQFVQDFADQAGGRFFFTQALSVGRVEGDQPPMGAEGGRGEIEEVLLTEIDHFFQVRSPQQAGEPLDGRPAAVGGIDPGPGRRWGNGGRLLAQIGPVGRPKGRPVHEGEGAIPARRDLPGQHGRFDGEGAAAAHGVAEHGIGVITRQHQGGRRQGFP